MRFALITAQVIGLVAALPSDFASRSARHTSLQSSSSTLAHGRNSSAATSSSASLSSPSSSSSNGSHTNATHSNGPADASSSWWFPSINSQTSSSTTDAVPGLDGYQVYFAIAGGDADGFVNAVSGSGPNGGNRDNGYIAMEPRVIYLAPGTYTLDKTLYIYGDTVIIGDAVNPPTIQPSSSFTADDNFFIVGGQGQDNPSRGGESHFSVMFKNVILNTTPQQSNSDFTALSWRVAQNTALVNVQVVMPSGVHTGVWVGQGSPVSVSDTSFSYGSIGLHYSGAQQAQLKNLSFSDCTTGIQIDGGDTISIIAPKFDTVGNSIVYNSGSPSVSVVDAVSVNSGDFFTSKEDSPNFILDNISKDTTDSNMVVVGSSTLFGGITSLNTYVYGNTYGASPVYQTGTATQSISRPTALTTGSAKTYPVLTAPQYADKTGDDVINLKDPSQNGGNTLYGDGVNDDTDALQTALNTAASAQKIAYLPFGTYLVSSTITIPLDTNLVGNGWSTITGYGNNFKTESSPAPVVQVGKPNDSGSIQIQDMRFTVKEELPGAIILQVNAAGGSPGDVAIFNSLITLGGTPDTNISCSDESQCAAAYLGLYLAEGSSAYIDNFWAWVADHPTDGSSAGINVAGKGGVQVDSTAATWFGGLGSEHWWLFNYNHNNAANVLTSFFQSETNYYQGNNGNFPPAPFTPTDTDPDFSWCNGSSGTCSRTIAQYFNGGANHFQYGAGSWTFDDGPQDNLNVINAYPDPMYLFGSCAISASGAGSASGSTEIFRLPDGSTFGDGKGDGYGGSWGILVAGFEYTGSS